MPAECVAVHLNLGTHAGSDGHSVGLEKHPMERVVITLVHHIKSLNMYAELFDSKERARGLPLNPATMSGARICLTVYAVHLRRGPHNGMAS